MYQIKGIRESRQISQTELATRAKISQPYLHDLENNKRGAKPETLQRIAYVLDVRVSDLIAKGVE